MSPTPDPETPRDETRLQLPALREPFRSDEVAEWWGAVEDRLPAARRTKLTASRRLSLTLAAASVALFASVALALGVAPPSAALFAPIGSSDPPPGSAQDKGSAPTAIPPQRPTAEFADHRTPAARAPGLPGIEPAPSTVPTVAVRSAGTSGRDATRGTPEPALARRSWRELARRGAFDEAFTELGTEGMARERAVANIEDLFALADVARLSGHPREAVSPLSEIVRRGGSQASIAALTLGRVRIDQLGEPDLAAQDFERAVELGLDGPLREGALARRVEALARAGQNDRATDAARAFASRYPTSKSRVEKWLPQSE